MCVQYDGFEGKQVDFDCILFILFKQANLVVADRGSFVKACDFGIQKLCGTVRRYAAMVSVILVVWCCLFRTLCLESCFEAGWFWGWLRSNGEVCLMQVAGCDLRTVFFCSRQDSCKGGSCAVTSAPVTWIW